MSLRTRLLVGLGLVAVVLLLAGTLVARTTEANLIRQVDEQLSRAAPRIRDANGALPGTERAAEDAPGQPSSLYVAVLVRGSLRTVYEPDLTSATAGIPDLTAAQVSARADTAAFTVGSTGSDVRFRVQVLSNSRLGRLLVYALPLEDVDETVRRLWAVQAAAALTILAVLGLVTFWVLRLGVRPVKQMTATATAIGQGDLSQRIPESAPGTEAGDLGVALNRMLSRLEEAFDERTHSEDRLRQFAADASHELRTPITTIRGYAELYRLGGLTDPADLAEAIRRTEQEAIRMGVLVEDLLQLARLDQGRPLELRPVDLASVLHDAARDSLAVEPDRLVTVDAPGPVTVIGDDARLRQIVANLVANARAHTPAGTAVHLLARPEGDRAVLEVRDEGPGMAPDVAARAFERFYRADRARSRHTGGSGLGLSIVASAVAAHGGQVELDSSPGHGTTVRVLLPTRPRVASQAPHDHPA